MDLKTIQGELQQLSELVEGWVQADDVPALERDLALEKLRLVYDKVRFGASEPAAETPSGEEDTAVAEVIDLGDVLSLDPFAGEEEPESVPEPEPRNRPPKRRFRNPGPSRYGPRTRHRAGACYGAGTRRGAGCGIRGRT